MKKLLMALGISLAAFSVQAADFASLTLENVTNNGSSNVKGSVQTLRVGKDVAGWNFGLQARTQTVNGGGLYNSLEAYAGKTYLVNKVVVAPYGGFGYDNGGVNVNSFQYGVLGVTALYPVNEFTPYVGAKTRVNWDNAAPNQTLVYLGVDYSINKQFAVGLTASRSWLDIQETTYGVNFRVAY